MKRQLFQTTGFVRALKKIVKKRPELAQPIKEAVAILQEDAFDSRLKTHKLAGELSKSWACSAGYDLRIIFSFVQKDEQQIILLDSIGNHDEVY